MFSQFTLSDIYLWLHAQLWEEAGASASAFSPQGSSGLTAGKRPVPRLPRAFRGAVGMLGGSTGVLQAGVPRWREAGRRSRQSRGMGCEATPPGFEGWVRGWGLEGRRENLPGTESVSESSGTTRDRARWPYRTSGSVGAEEQAPARTRTGGLPWRSSG